MHARPLQSAGHARASSVSYMCNQSINLSVALGDWPLAMPMQVGTKNPREPENTE